MIYTEQMKGPLRLNSRKKQTGEFNMKRFTILLLALALCGSLAACSDEKAESGKIEDNVAVGVADPGKDKVNTTEPVGSEKEPDTTSGEDKPSGQETPQNPTEDTVSDKTQESQPQTGGSVSNQTTQQSKPQDTTSVQSHPNQSQTVTTPTPEPETIPETQSTPDYEVTPEPQPTPESQPVQEAQPAPEPAMPTLEQASGYVGSSASALEGALGSPVSKEYSPSCMGEGEDGMWVYADFTVYTYRENGVETVEAVR